MIRFIVFLVIALCVFTVWASAADGPKVEPGITFGSKASPEVQYEVKVFTFKKGQGSHSILRGLCEDSSTGHAVLGPSTYSAVLREMLTDSRTTTIAYPRIVSAWDRECQIRSVVGMPAASGAKTQTVNVGTEIQVNVGTEIQVNASPAKDQQIRCRWDISSSVLAGYTGDKSPIIAKASHAADTLLRPGESIAVLCEPQGKDADGSVFILTPKRFVN